MTAAYLERKSVFSFVGAETDKSTISIRERDEKRKFFVPSFAFLSRIGDLVRSIWPDATFDVSALLCAYRVHVRKRLEVLVRF